MVTAVISYSPLGRLLRELNIEEYPNFWNVLRAK